MKKNQQLNITQHIQSTSIDQLYSIQQNYLDEDEDNSHSENETDSEEIELPIYISKTELTKRKETESIDTQTIQNIQNIENNQIEIETQKEMQIEKEEKIKEHNQQYIQLTLQHQSKSLFESSDDDTEEFSSRDEFGGEEEYLQWQEREMIRLKKEYIELLTYKRDLKTLEEIELNNNNQSNTNSTNSNNQNNQHEKTQYKFLQKYYHIGSFFRDGGEWDVSRGKWDFDAATGDDWMDKLALPKILQTKQWGKKGRSKHTNLKDEDTTFRQYD